MSIFKNKKNYWLGFLGFIFFAQITFFFTLQFYTLPFYKANLKNLEHKVEQLQDEKTRLYDDAGITQALSDYEEKAELVKVFQSSRNNVFSLGEEGKFDFVPNLLDTIFPVVTAHLHNDIMVESISINEKAEVVIPVLADSYTILSKQLLAFKQAFKKEPVPLLTNIKVNTFTRQEMEILERDENRNFVKQRKKVSKATIIAQINPAFFENMNTEASTESSSEVAPAAQMKKTSWIQKINNVVNNILSNIQKDIVSISNIF